MCLFVTWWDLSYCLRIFAQIVSTVDNPDQWEIGGSTCVFRASWKQSSADHYVLCKNKWIKPIRCVMHLLKFSNGVYQYPSAMILYILHFYNNNLDGQFAPFIRSGPYAIPPAYWWLHRISISYLWVHIFLFLGPYCPHFLLSTHPHHIRTVQLYQYNRHISFN